MDDNGTKFKIWHNLFILEPHRAIEFELKCPKCQMNGLFYTLEKGTQQLSLCLARYQNFVEEQGWRIFEILTFKQLRWIQLTFEQQDFIFVDFESFVDKFSSAINKLDYKEYVSAYLVLAFFTFKDFYKISRKRTD